MPKNIRHRLITRRVERPATRIVTRCVVRTVTRSVVRQAWRTVIPYDGPSLNNICALLSAYVKMAEAHDRRRNPKPRLKRKPNFEPLCSPEEHRRKFLADMERCYGTGSGTQSPGVTNEAPRYPISPPPAPTPASLAPDPVSTEKKDVIAVPLHIGPSGLLHLDWTRAH